MKTFDYHEAETLEETVQILSSGEEVRILAGGCGILLVMKEKLYFPSGIVNIKKVPGLKYVQGTDAEIKVGALSTHNEVKRSSIVQEKVPMLAEALGLVATDRIRNMATLGGTLTHADPTSDAAPALLALEAKARIFGKEGEKKIPLESFFVDYFETVLEPTDVLIEIIIPLPPDRAGGTYIRFQVRKAMEKAMPGVAALICLEEDGKTIRMARMAMSGVGNTCIRLKEAEEFLAGKEDHPDVREKIGGMVKQSIDPVSEYHFSSEYQKEVAGIFVQRAFTGAYKRAAAS